MALLSLTGKEFLELLKAGKIQETGRVCCKKCGIPLRERVTGNRQVGTDRYCSDCYFEELGELIDEMPIGIRSVSR